MQKNIKIDAILIGCDTEKAKMLNINKKSKKNNFKIRLKLKA